MLRVTRTALKYFTYGVLVGLFFAPRPGDETRRAVLDWIGQRVGELSGVLNGESAEA